MPTLKEKGLERILSKLHVTQEDLEFEGRIAALEKKRTVGQINYNYTHKSPPYLGGPTRDYSVYMKKILSPKEILKMLKETSFPNPNKISVVKNNVRKEYFAIFDSLTGVSHTLRFVMPTRDEKWTPDFGYLDKD